MLFEFDETYFKDEERSGFLITECMKRYWAAALRTVEIFDEICRRYNLSYWADCGSMLGAFRHHGFIPWDDDIDLGMPRKDYNLFLEIAEKELPEGFFVSRYESNVHKYNGTTVVINHQGTLFSSEILGEYYNCPFPVGFDLYPYDNVPDDENELQKWRLDYLRCLHEIRTMREDMEKEGNVDFEKLKEKVDEAEIVAARYAGSDTENMTRFIFMALENKSEVLKRKWCDIQMEMPFETATIPVPLYIEEVLLSRFGADYVRSVKAASAHNYPLYKRDIVGMMEFLKNGGIELKDLPPILQYIRREAEYRGIYKEK
ncbi:MAG: LicD family protein [Butyrivibrio sp.]|nr:LicD family protein [Butyrivibrio sp.]